MPSSQASQLCDQLLSVLPAVGSAVLSDGSSGLDGAVRDTQSLALAIDKGSLSPDVGRALQALSIPSALWAGQTLSWFVTALSGVMVPRMVFRAWDTAIADGGGETFRRVAMAVMRATTPILCRMVRLGSAGSAGALALPMSVGSCLEACPLGGGPLANAVAEVLGVEMLRQCFTNTSALVLGVEEAEVRRGWPT